MAYNNGFPVNYQPYYQQQQAYMPQQPQAQSGSSIIWVQGEAGAKSYLVAPNTTVQLWDSESQTIYLKSADASGMPSIKVLDYTIRNEAPNRPVGAVNAPIDNSHYKDELMGLQRQIDALRSDFEAMKKTEGKINESAISKTE